MPPEIVARKGPLTGSRFPVGDEPVTFGRKSDNTVVITGRSASRLHAELVRDGDGHLLRDRGSRNGTVVNGHRVESHRLLPGDLIEIGGECFCYEAADAMETVLDLELIESLKAEAAAAPDPGVLTVAVSGGGPVGLAFALLLEDLLGERVAITIYDGRWTRDGSRVVWKTAEQGNVRRQQVVTVQSRQYLNLPEAVRERLFEPGAYSEMWPAGPDSVGGFAPRNIRISYIEDKLLEIAAGKPDRIRLVPERFDAAALRENGGGPHVLAICEGGRSRTREHFTDKFGTPDTSIYSLDGEHLQDVVLGLRVRSALPDPMTVLLTVAQNRFLLNSLRGEGFLNMRLTAAEAAEVVGIDPVRRVFEECVAARPCVMARGEHGDFRCDTHSTLFLPALVKGSPLWRRALEGLELFGVAEEDLSAVSAFRLDMVQRPRFTARLTPGSANGPGTYGFLLGDAANAIHFWPGRGLNSGLASAISLARSLTAAWRGRPFRDADFVRHEAAMSMLQYRHKSRAWNAMVVTDEQGTTRAIKDVIAASVEAPAGHPPDPAADTATLMERLVRIRERLAPRVPGMPDDDALRARLETLRPETLRTLADSGEWDTLIAGGEEVDIDIFHRQAPDAPLPAAPPAVPAQRAAAPDAAPAVPTA